MDNDKFLIECLMLNVDCSIGNLGLYGKYSCHFDPDLSGEKSLVLECLVIPDLPLPVIDPFWAGRLDPESIFLMLCHFDPDLSGEKSLVLECLVISNLPLPVIDPFGGGRSLCSFEMTENLVYLK